MPTYLMVAGDSGGGASLGAGSNRYYALGGSLPLQGTEARVQTLVRDSYTSAMLQVLVLTNSLSGDATFRMRVNGANGNQIVTVGTTLTGLFEDAVNTDSVVAGDLLNIHVNTAAGTGAVVFSVLASTLATASNTTPILVSSAPDAYAHAQGTTAYYSIIGGMLARTTETDAQYTVRASSTLSNMRAYIASNNVDNDSTLRIRINVGNGNQVLTVAANTTGAFEDTVNTDSVVAGDEVCYSLAAGAGIAGDTIRPSVWHIKSNSAGQQVGTGHPTGMSLTSGLTRYVAIGGDPDGNATEANVQIQANAAFTAQKFFVNVRSNNLDGSTTFTDRKDTNPGSLTITVASSTTGLFEDTVNTTSYVAASLINFSVVTAGTTGSLIWTLIGFELAQAAGGNITVTPGVINLTTSAFIPVLNFVLTPTTLATTTTTFAPVLGHGIVVPVLAQTITTYIPIIDTAYVVGLLAQTLTTFAPTATVTANITVTPGVVALTLTGFAPDILGILTTALQTLNRKRQTLSSISFNKL